jgi:outer membrane protein
MNPTKTKLIAECIGQRQLLILLCFAIVVLTPVLAVAQSPETPVADSLTLERCIAVARGNSPELRIASSAVEASRLDRKLADQSRWPRLRFVGGAGYAPASLDFGYDPAVSNGGELGAQIVAEQTLYSGGRLGLQTEQATTAIVQHSLESQQQDRNLVYAVRQAFIELLAAEQQRDLIDQSLEQLAGYADLVAGLRSSGRVGNADVLSARVELARGQIDSSKASIAATSARLNLSRLLGLPQDSVLTIVGSLDNLLVDVSDTTVDTSDTTRIENLDISTAQLGLKQSHLALDLTRSQWKPTVALTADAGLVTSRENLLLPSADRYRSASL